MSEPRQLALIVPVLNNFKGLAELMASIDYPIYPIIVDNWNENRGVARAWNAGLNTAIKRGIGNALVANDDVVLHPGTIDKMMQALLYQGQLFVSANDDTKMTPTKYEAYDDEPDFACFMVHPKQFINKVGWFDERIYPAYFEDNDMAYRMKLSGMSLNRARRLDAAMTHKGSVTQNWNGGMVVSHQAFEKNRLYYQTKWGGLPGQETYKTPNGLGNSFKDW